MMDIDKRIAVEVMEWELGLHPDFDDNWWFEYISDRPYQEYKIIDTDWHPSTNIVQAFEVVEKMRAQRPDGSDGYNFNLNWQGHKGITVCLAQFHRIDGNLEFGQGASGDPAEAVCLAALKAVEVKS